MSVLMHWIFYLYWLATIIWGQEYYYDDKETDIYQFEKFTNDSLLWAPYRSNCYFGIRPRYVNDEPLMLGLMWMNTIDANPLHKLRHLVDQNDKMEKYGWELYDPRLGGRQVIIDSENNLNLTIYFVKSQTGENWGFRVHGEVLDNDRLSTASMVLYFNQNGKDNVHLIKTGINNHDQSKLEFTGISNKLGNYDISIMDNYGVYYSGQTIFPDCDTSKTNHISITVPDKHVWKSRDIFQTLLGDSLQDIASHVENLDILSMPSAMNLRNIHNFPPGNFHFVQKTFDLSESSFDFDFIYNKDGTVDRIESLDHMIDWTLNKIKSKFERKFQIDDPKKKKFAQETLSNLLGGIGYFHGTQLVDRITELNEEQFETIQLTNPYEEGPLDLFTCVPSRAFFPRGFYWDEGFHLLQVMKYDFDLAFEILRSWIQLIDEDGWVAREIILGEEARSKVPPEFQVQNPSIANPPTLFLAFSEMLTQSFEYQTSYNYDCGETLELETENLKKNLELLILYTQRIYPKLLKHYHWFRNTQRGMIEEYIDYIDESFHHLEAYKWMGRTFTHCLPSGLDDYPRAQPPDVAELHVDTLSWVGVMTRSMRQISEILGLIADTETFAKIEQDIIENLDILHWNKELHTYCDLTIDDDSENPKKYVCHEGYISLLPFALKLLPRDSSNIDHIIKLMSDKNKLFSKYGLLSLSRQDEYFETGEAYWRGPVWVNINYLCLDALRFYFEDNTTTKQAKKLYHDLRSNLINNVYNVWYEDGYCYEQYHQNTGRGSGVQHFTGWTALLVNIIGDFPENI